MVKQMVKQDLCVGVAVDKWIAEEDLPAGSGLRPVRLFDELRIFDREEAEAYWDFIGWFLGRDYALLECVPVGGTGKFFVSDDSDCAISHAFGSADYLDSVPEFNKYAYRLRKVFERVKVLAITHSCAFGDDGKQRVFGKYKALVEAEFRDEAVRLAEGLKCNHRFMDKDKAEARIRELNKRIRQCRKVWEKHCFGD
jgi:hypothetical protein